MIQFQRQDVLENYRQITIFFFLKTTICLTNLTFTFHTKTPLMLHVSGIQLVICWPDILTRNSNNSPSLTPVEKTSLHPTPLSSCPRFELILPTYKRIKQVYWKWQPEILVILLHPLFYFITRDHVFLWKSEYLYKIIVCIH